MRMQYFLFTTFEGCYTFYSLAAERPETIRGGAI